MDTKKENKIAIVTGGAMGIGQTISKRLVEEGYFVVIADINDEAATATTKSIGEDKCAYIRCDVGEEAQVAQLYETIAAKYGVVYLLVNNSGIIRDTVIWKMTTEDFDAVIRVNLRGTWLMCRQAAMVMREQKAGRIVNIGSRAWLGNPGQTNYSASKAGVVGMTRALALEMGRYGVIVNTVAPGLIDTPLSQGLPEDVREKLLQAQPTKTMGSPMDVAEAVIFLARPDTTFITGQTLHVDGGKSVGVAI